MSLFDVKIWKQQQQKKCLKKACEWKSLTLGSHGLYSSWNSPGKISGVGSLSLLQVKKAYSKANWESEIMHILFRQGRMREGI